MPGFGDYVLNGGISRLLIGKNTCRLKKQRVPNKFHTSSAKKLTLNQTPVIIVPGKAFFDVGHSSSSSSSSLSLSPFGRRSTATTVTSARHATGTPSQCNLGYVRANVVTCKDNFRKILAYACALIGITFPGSCSVMSAAMRSLCGSSIIRECQRRNPTAQKML